jgi:hypothetical protein
VTKDNSFEGWLEIGIVQMGVELLEIKLERATL